MSDRKPALRIDGNKRVDLKAQRARQDAATKARREGPPAEDTRVSKAWSRQEGRDRAAVKDAGTAKRMKVLREKDGLKDGNRLSTIDITISATRTEKRAIRCRPGTFEWRYGRNDQSAYYHAGVHFALIWERAGTNSAKSVDLSSAGGGGAGWKGLPEGRVAALEEAKAARVELGAEVTSRLVDYCVLGLTSAEIARKQGQRERDIAAVLHQDLRACAMHFRFL